MRERLKALKAGFAEIGAAVARRPLAVVGVVVGMIAGACWLYPSLWLGLVAPLLVLVAIALGLGLLAAAI